MAFGLLALRLVTGLLLAGHGVQKLFGWLGGPGPAGTAQMYDGLGYPRPRAMALLAGAAEAGGGLLLAAGLLTPLAGAALIGVMINAIAAVHWDNGLWVADGGFEYNLVLIAVGGALGFVGPGAWSLDAALGWDLAGAWWGVATLAVGAISGAAVLATRDSTPEPDAGGAGPSGAEREREHQPA